MTDRTELIAADTQRKIRAKLRFNQPQIHEALFADLRDFWAASKHGGPIHFWVQNSSVSPKTPTWHTLCRGDLRFRSGIGHERGLRYVKRVCLECADLFLKLNP